MQLEIITKRSGMVIPRLVLGQGINILPGSFMTGQTKWAIYGGILVVAGIGLLISANRRRI